MPAEPQDLPALGPLPPADLLRLARRYESDRDRWRRSGRIAEARARLERVAKAAAALQESMGDLLPVDLRLAGLPTSECDELRDAVARIAETAARGLQKIADEGGGRGGNRTAEALLSPSPRTVLAGALRDRLGEAPTRALLEQLAHVLELAGEPEAAGLEDVVRGLPRRPEREGR